MNDTKIMRFNLFKQFLAAGLLVSFFAEPIVAADNDLADKKNSKPAFKISPPSPTNKPSNANYISLSQQDVRSEQWETFFGGSIIVRNVSSAGFYSYAPSPETANGKTIVVLPGGGYQFVSMGNEGFPVAQRLQAEGYRVFLLKYSTKESPRDGAEFLESAAPSFMSLGKTRLSYYEPALDDLTSGLAFLNKNCSELGCDSSQISLIGFSAGARTVMGAIERAPNVNALESIALMYPPTIDTFDTDLTTPLFVAMAADDPLFKQGRFNLLDHWLEHSPDLEFHLYSGGGHGFGMNANGATSQNWIEHYVSWLSLHINASPAQ